MPNTNYVSKHTGGEIDEAVDAKMYCYMVTMNFDGYYNTLEMGEPYVEGGSNAKIFFFSPEKHTVTKDNLGEILKNISRCAIIEYASLGGASALTFRGVRDTGLLLSAYNIYDSSTATGRLIFSEATYFDVVSPNGGVDVTN